jgi:hypothetical protein
MLAKRTITAAGSDCCSMDTISFTTRENKEVVHPFFATREAPLKNPQMSHQELKDFMLKECFPGQVGFYSAGSSSKAKG